MTGLVVWLSVLVALNFVSAAVMAGKGSVAGVVGATGAALLNLAFVVLILTGEIA